VLNDVIDLKESEIKQIETSILALPEEQKNSLKPVFEQFEGFYSYDILRCVKAALQYQIES
jgi:ATP-dependent DNA helicase RecQ